MYTSHLSKYKVAKITKHVCWQKLYSFLVDIAYTALQGGSKCLCRHSLSSNELTEENCNDDCTGEPSRKCGGDHAMSVYATRFAFGGK